MKKFEFSLETVHKVREMNEEKELAILARLRERVSKSEQLIEEIESARLDLMEKYIGGLQNGTAANAAELDLYSRRFASLEKQRIETENALKEQRIECSSQIEILSKAAMEVKVTESLRDKQQALHDLERSRNEQTALDEITGAKYARKSAAEQNAYDAN